MEVLPPTAAFKVPEKATPEGWGTLQTAAGNAAWGLPWEELSNSPTLGTPFTLSKEFRMPFVIGNTKYTEPAPD